MRCDFNQFGMHMKFAFYFITMMLFFGSFNICKAQNDSSYVRTEEEGKVDENKKPFKEKKEHSTFKQNLFFGLYPGFSWSNYAFSYELSPLMGVEVLPKFSVGVGILYKHTGGKDFNTNGYLYKYKFDNIGGRAFAFYDVYKSFCAYAEYEGANVYYSDEFDRKFQQWQPALKTGLLYKSQMGEKFYVNFLVLYNLLYQEGTTISGNPLDLRIGIAFFPFRS